MRRNAYGYLFFLFLLCFVLGSAYAEEGDVSSVVYLDLSHTKWKTANEILPILEEHPHVEAVTFGKWALSADILDAIWEVYPNLKMEYNFQIGKRLVRSTDEEAVVRSKLDVDELIENFKYLPNLRVFENFETRYSYEQMEIISERYPNLHMRCTLNFRDHRVRTTVTAFSTLHSTKSDRHTEEDFLILKYIDNLLALDLGHNAITDISFLEHFPALKVLILADNQISNLEPIRVLKELEYLELFRNPIENVEALAELENLMELNISYCNIHDAEPLLALKNLKRLWISQNTWFLPEEQQQLFRETMPDCEFNFTCTTGSSGGGWRRNHSRYTTVKKIFDTRKYRPFSK